MNHEHRSQSPHAGRIDHRSDARPMAEAAGRSGRRDEPIASLETDKVAVEVPSPVAGVMGAAWSRKATPSMSAR
jgi:hypothetical protein